MGNMYIEMIMAYGNMYIEIVMDYGNMYIHWLRGTCV